MTAEGRLPAELSGGPFVPGNSDNNTASQYPALPDYIDPPQPQGISGSRNRPPARSGRSGQPESLPPLPEPPIKRGESPLRCLFTGRGQADEYLRLSLLLPGPSGGLPVFPEGAVLSVLRNPAQGGKFRRCPGFRTSRPETTCACSGMSGLPPE